MQYNISNNEKGFSLIELMVVLVIVGILTGLMIPNISGLIAQQEINEAAQNVAGVIRTAKEIAITKNVDTAVWFDTVNKRYIVGRALMPNEAAINPNSYSYNGITYYQIGQGVITIKNNIGFQTNATTNPSNTGTPPAAPNSITFPATGGGYIATFTSRGTSNGGTIYLQPDKEFIQTKMEKMRAITVSAATGRARIYSWNPGITTANKWE